MKAILVSSICFFFALAAIAGEATGPQLELGAKAPSFTLKGTDGKMHSLSDLKGATGTAVVFTCNACPFSKAYEDRLISLAKSYTEKGIVFVAINPNDPKVQPKDGYEEMIVRAKEKEFPFPYLVDETQEIAKAYGAQVTPHVFLFDGEGVLKYRGRVDDSAKEGEIKSYDLKNALDAIANGKTVPEPATKAFGCGVKWKKTA